MIRQHYYGRLSKYSCIVAAAMLVTALGLLSGQAAAASATVCNSLTSQLSDDKNYYVFTAMATAGSGATITGYNFDFGDHQSYSFTFGNVATRGQATVRHTYEESGDYLVKAAVVTTANGKTNTTTSPNCQVNVTIGASSSNPLLNVGPGNSLGIFIGATTIAALAHAIWTRRR
jgi:hypothetical protein